MLNSQYVTMILSFKDFKNQKKIEKNDPCVKILGKSFSGGLIYLLRMKNQSILYYIWPKIVKVAKAILFRNFKIAKRFADSESAGLIYLKPIENV